MSPTPRANTPLSYTVTVTNSATGTPVPQASVVIHNFTSTGVQNLGPLPTDATGKTQPFTATLRPRISFRVDPVTHERERIFVSPTLTVSADGFTPITLTLLQDTSDLSAGFEERAEDPAHQVRRIRGRAPGRRTRPHRVS